MSSNFTRRLLLVTQRRASTRTSVPAWRAPDTGPQTLERLPDALMGIAATATGHLAPRQHAVGPTATGQPPGQIDGPAAHPTWR